MAFVTITKSGPLTTRQIQGMSDDRIGTLLAKEATAKWGHDLGDRVSGITKKTGDGGRVHEVSAMFWLYTDTEDEG